MRAPCATLFVIAFVGLALSGCLSALTGQMELKPAPSFTITDTQGQTRSKETYNGSVVIVDLMATWCIPCRAQMEHLKTVRDSYPPDKVQILSVGTDQGESNEMLDAFAKQYGGSWPFARDTDGVSQKLGLRILPKLVIINPQGEIVFENQGETYPAAMARIINQYEGPA